MRAERGVVLVVALIAMMAMGFSGMALMRLINATTAITGNMAFRHSAASSPDVAIEDAIAALFEERLIGDPTIDVPDRSYYASRAAGEDARGIPAVLQQVTRYPDGARVIDAGNGNTVRYVIERLCLNAGPPTPDNCALVPTADAALVASAGAFVEPPRVPSFRQTVRVDGPAGATLFVQAWLADIPGRRRLSWRAIGDR